MLWPGSREPSYNLGHVDSRTVLLVCILIFFSIHSQALQEDTEEGEKRVKLEKASKLGVLLYGPRGTPGWQWPISRLGLAGDAAHLWGLTWAGILSVESKINRQCQPHHRRRVQSYRLPYPYEQQPPLSLIRKLFRVQISRMQADLGNVRWPRRL